MQQDIETMNVAPLEHEVFNWRMKGKTKSPRDCNYASLAMMTGISSHGMKCSGSLKLDCRESKLPENFSKMFYYGYV